MKYIIKRNDQDYVIKADQNGNGGYNVVPKKVDPFNQYTIQEVEAYLAENPDHLLDLPELEAEQLKEQIRAKRDSLIQEVEWRVRRHKDEVELGLEPTDPLLPLLEYIQNLREVPQQNGFPYEIEWPVLEEVDG